MCMPLKLRRRFWPGFDKGAFEQRKSLVISSRFQHIGTHLFLLFFMLLFPLKSKVKKKFRSYGGLSSQNHLQNKDSLD